MLSTKPIFLIEKYNKQDCNGQMKWTTSDRRNGLLMDNLMDSPVEMSIRSPEISTEKDTLTTVR